MPTGATTVTAVIGVANYSLTGLKSPPQDETHTLYYYQAKNPWLER